MHESTPSVSLLLPTRNRPDTLRRTLAAIGGLPLPPISRAADHGCEVVVVDNDSDTPVDVPTTLANGLEVALIRLRSNVGAASRNYGACVARGQWLLMLDDDSRPLDAAFADVVEEAPPDLVAIGAEIVLRSGKREDGGLPEVIVGCGALIRRDAFLAVRGYDASFQYYVEEYDLCARFIRAGYRITHDQRFRVLHEKTAAGRDMNAILHKLVRNNGWVLARYAPDDVSDRALAGTIARYREIAQRENAMQGFAAGLAELEDTLADQPRSPLSTEQYDRFTGLAAARSAFQSQLPTRTRTRAAIIDKGKYAWAVRQALTEIPSVTIVEHEFDADVLVIGTLSPGPMFDALARRNGSSKPVLQPWLPADHAPHAASMPFQILRTADRIRSSA